MDAGGERAWANSGRIESVFLFLPLAVWGIAAQAIESRPSDTACVTQHLLAELPEKTYYGCMRFLSFVRLVGAVVLVAAAALTQQFPLRQKTEKLATGPMRVDKVKDGLFVIRGPFVPCGTRGCRPGGADDKLIHEPGDVALRVTSEGAILIDDKYPENVADVLALVKTITQQPVKFLLNTHHHGDHALSLIHI